MGVETTAKTSFSRQFSCPADRVRVSQAHGRPYLPAPPPEIASDPERLAMYEHRNEVYWDVSGCNEQAYYNCYRPEVTEPAWQCEPILPPRSAKKSGDTSPTLRLLSGAPQTDH